jgi:KaiC/GvpD/RAD55 family RecA-like ATPase
MTTQPRLSTGIAGLDELLGGGLAAGTLTVVLGATGIGKTQMGLQYARAGLEQEGRSGIIFDMSARGDSQHHVPYAQRMFDWRLELTDADEHVRAEDFFHADHRPGDCLHVFDHGERKVTRGDLDFDAWCDWRAEVIRRLNSTIAFFYGNFVRGTRRAVVDGIEPVDRTSDSVQLELFERIYHQVVRKDPEWVARDLFRHHYRANAEAAAQHVYDPDRIGCMLLCTSRETSLDALIERPLKEGDLLSVANTVVYLGKVREGRRFRRAMYVPKHRGSVCPDEIIPYRIEDGGLRLE